MGAYKSAGGQMVKAAVLYTEDVGVQVPPGGLGYLQRWVVGPLAQSVRARDS